MNRIGLYLKIILKQTKILLADQRGDLYFQKMILIAISFVVGAIILSALYTVFDSTFADRLTQIIEQILAW